MNICDVEIIENLNRLRDKSVVLYGSGNWGMRVYKELKALDIFVEHVAKTTAYKEEKFEDGIKVEQISAIAEEINNPEHVIIIASQIYGEEMIAHLDSLGVGGEDGASILTLRAFNTAVLVNVDKTVAPPPPEDIGQGIKEKYRFIQRGSSKTFSVWRRGSSFSADGILLYGLPSAQDSTGLRVWKGAAG